MCCQVAFPQIQSRFLLRESWWHCRGLWNTQTDGWSRGAVLGQVVTLNYSCCIQRGIPQSWPVISPLLSTQAAVCGWAWGPQSANRSASHPLSFELRRLDAKLVLVNTNGINLEILSGGLSKYSWMLVGALSGDWCFLFASCTPWQSRWPFRFLLNTQGWFLSILSVCHKSHYALKVSSKSLRLFQVSVAEG